MLIGAVAMFALGCGGGGDRATARPATPSPTGTATATGTPTATVARPGLRLQRIGNFSSPVYVTAPPGDRSRIFVVEQGGTVRIVRGGKKIDRPFLDISGRISSGSERGLLSLAFPPDYASSGLFYVYYTAGNGDIRIVEFRRASAERADHDSARTVLSVTHPASNHNGGLVLFGPGGLLYAGLGDGGGGGDQHGARGNGQNRSTLLGKILRFDPRRSGGQAYRVPSGNPFVGRSGVRPEIFAYGVRNPWRFSFTPNGNLVVGDVGQGAVEEVTVVRRKGANLGWRVWRAAAATRRARPRPATCRRPSSASIPTATARSPAAWWCATPCFGAAGPLRVRRLLPRPDRVGGPAREPRAQCPRRAAAKSAACPRSARTPAAASTRPRSAARSTGSSRVERGPRGRRRRPRPRGQPEPLTLSGTNTWVVPAAG